jgi:hypothetical protein|tara:strand:- start:1310 stop:2059 length:750 start_codon:yes stop_codon:yes gene_type:complete
MKVFSIYTKILLFPIYYLIHSNKFFGYIQKYYLKKFYYQNIIINLDIDNIPLASYSSFLFKTYEYNDRRLVEKYIDSNNSCIIIGGGLGFIPVLAYKKSKKKILVFEIDKKLIKNLNDNLIKNNCEFQIYEKNLILGKKIKNNEEFYFNEDFSSNSKYLKKGKKRVIENISSVEIKTFEEYNSLIIDGEGIEEYFIQNLNHLKNIKYIIFELHFNIFSKNKIEKFFKSLELNKFIFIDKCFNSYYFKKI